MASATSSAADAASATARRLGASFRLLMHVRMLVTLITLLVLPTGELTAAAFVIIAGLCLLSWLAARHWERLVPQLVRHPLFVGVDIFVSFVVLSIEGPLGPFLLSTLVTSAAAGLLYRWRGIVLVSAFQIICYFASFGYYSELTGGGADQLATFQALFAQPAYYPLVGFAGLLLRRLFDEQAAAAEAQRNAEVRGAAADERARLAREMHDSLAKTLRGIAMGAAALPAWTRKSPERAAVEAQRVASAAEIASREARELIADLRDDQVQLPLTRSAADVAARWSARCGIQIRTDLAEIDGLPLLARYEMVAILKEALSNVERHSGAARVRVELAGNLGGVSLTVADDGAGFATAPDTAGPGADASLLTELAAEGHYGVVGMHERAKRAGGTLAVTSAPGEGTTIRLDVPGDPAAAPIAPEQAQAQETV